MSTRAVVKVIFGNAIVNIYKHHDGYIKNGFGEYLFKLIKDFNDRPLADDVNELVSTILKDKEETQITLYNHQDLSCLYTIEFEKNKAILKYYTIDYQKILSFYNNDSESAFREYEKIMDNWQNNYRDYLKFLEVFDMKKIQEIIGNDEKK